MDSTEIIKRAFRSLSPREQKIFTMRIVEKRTLEEAGNELDVTRERIRQLEKETCTMFYKTIKAFEL